MAKQKTAGRVEAGIYYRPDRPSPYKAVVDVKGVGQRSQSFPTLKAARDWRAAVRADVLRQQYVDPLEGKVTFGALAEEWFDAFEAASDKPRTVTFYRACWTRGCCRPSVIGRWRRSRPTTSIGGLRR